MGIEEEPVGALNPEMQGIKLRRVDFVGEKEGRGKSTEPVEHKRHEGNTQRAHPSLSEMSKAPCAST